MIENEEFLSIKEFARLVKVHPNTVRRAIKSGRLSAFRIGKGERAVYRIPKTEIHRIALIDLETIVNRIVEEKCNSHFQKNK